jgi:hypothetical protein
MTISEQDSCGEAVEVAVISLRTEENGGNAPEE